MSWAESAPHAGAVDRLLLHVRELPLGTSSIKDYADFTEHGGSNSSTMDVQRGMPRGSNHSAQEVARDTERDQEAQVGRRRASAITRSTGLRRRERRFE